MIDVEAAAAADRHAASGTPTAEPARARAAEPAGSSESTTLLACIIDALLEFVSAHPVERIRRVAGNCD